MLQSAADFFIFMLAGGKHTLIPNLPPVSCVHHLTLREADSLPYRRYSGSLVGEAFRLPLGQSVLRHPNSMVWFHCRGVLQSAADLFIFMLAGGKHTLIPNLPPVSCVHHLTLREADSLPYRRYSGSLVGEAFRLPLGQSILRHPNSMVWFHCRGDSRIARHESPATNPPP